MRHSIYLSLAILCVKADLKREERQWRQKIRRSAYDIPWHNQHLLRDIGLDKDGRSVQHADSNQLVATRRVYSIRRLFRVRNSQPRITT